MDDIVVMDDDKERLMDSFLRLNDFSGERMKLHIGRWNLSPATRGVNFLGYRIWATHKLLRKDTVLRAKRKVANFLRHEDHAGLAQFVASWRGHTQWADAHNLNQWMENRYGITL
jgi:hypothetical protein